MIMVKTPSIAVMTVLLLGGCVMSPDTDPGLDSAIKTHYAAHATEEGGKCRTPKIDTIQSHQITGNSEEGGEVMSVRYSYYDRHADMDANLGAFFHQAQTCGGMAERSFSLVRTELGYRVTAMEGEHRGEASAR